MTFKALKRRVLSKIAFFCEMKEKSLASERNEDLCAQAADTEAAFYVEAAAAIMQLGITHLPPSDFDIISKLPTWRQPSLLPELALHQSLSASLFLDFQVAFSARQIISGATLEMRQRVCTHGCLINCLLSLEINVGCVSSGRTSLIMHVFGARLLKMQLSSYALLRNSKQQTLMFIRINYVLGSFKHTLSRSQILGNMLEKLSCCKLVDFVLDPWNSNSS